MAGLDQQTIEALATLLVDVRASVEAEVALAGGATEISERAACMAMGREDVEACVALHEHLARAGASVSALVGGDAAAIRDAERYDDRLRAFAAHQRRVGQCAYELLETLPEREEALRRALLMIYESHVRYAAWAEHRAEEFAATREWTPKGAAGQLGASVSAGATGHAVQSLTIPAERALLVVDRGEPANPMPGGQRPGVESDRSARAGPSASGEATPPLEDDQ